jgi:hypothetical protein
MLLTIPSTPEKGESQTYTLNVSDLIALVNSAYYEDETNWRKVIVAYKSLTGNQLNLLSFIPDGNPTISKDGFFAPECFSFFIVQSITIVDKQNGTYILNNSDIPNVSDYNIIFIDADSSFYSMFANYGANLSQSSDGNFIAVQSNYDSVYDSKFYYSFVMNQVTEEIDENLTSFVNYFKVDSYFFNADNTKVYVVGKLGTNYLGETLPSIPVGPTYSANPPRLVSIDTVTNEVTYIATLQDAGIFSAFGEYVFNIIVDETLNVAIMVGLSGITAYNILSGVNLWYKSVIFATNSVYARKIEIYTSDSFLLGSFSNYDGVAYPFYTPIKINLLTGNRDNSLALSPQDSTNDFKWSLTPDKTKIVQMADGEVSKFFVFSSGSWSALINYSSGPIAVTAMTTDNSAIYLTFNTGVKCDFSGNQIGAFSLPNVGTIRNIIFANTNVFAQGFKFNSTTGVRDLSYRVYGEAFYERNAVGNYVYYMRTDMNTVRYNYPTSYNFSDAYYLGYVAIINPISREKINHFQATSGSPSQTFGPVFGSNGSNIIFTGSEQATSFKAFNFLTGIQDNTFPVINSSTQLIGGYAKDGDYIYLASNIYDDGANTFNVTDTSGTYNIVTKIMRFNYVTKLVDTTFLPSIPLGFFGLISLSFTDNYIYACGINAVGNLWRINKTTQIVEQILPSSLGLSSPVAWSNTRIRFTQLAANKVIAYPNGTSNTLFDNRPYIVLNEDTLTQQAFQPDTISFFPKYYAYNSTNNQLGGIFLGLDNIWTFATYNLLNNSQTVITTNANENNTSLVNSTGDFLNQGYLSFMAFESSYMMFLTGIFGLDYKPFGGVIKMNPLGIINNE